MRFSLDRGIFFAADFLNGQFSSEFGFFNKAHLPECVIRLASSAGGTTGDALPGGNRTTRKMVKVSR